MKETLLILFSFVGVCLGQTPQWITFNSTTSGLSNDHISSIAIDGSNNKWIGTVYGGLAMFDGTSWTVYTYSNSGIGIQNIECITIDANNNKWLGSGWNSPISKYDNSVWTVYDSAATNNIIKTYSGRTFDILADNGKIYIGKSSAGLKLFDGTTWSDLTPNLVGPYIYDLETDGKGNKWIGHWNNGITKFDGTTWTNFNSTNTPLPSNDITSIAFESNGVMWATSRYHGLVKFDGTTWTVYTTSNSGLPSNSMNTIKIDKNDIKWIATGDGSTNFGSGLVKFTSPTNVAVYTTSNSGIPSNDVICIAIDKFNNKWVGTERNGVGAFNESGIAAVNTLDRQISSVNYYPNPFTEKITFSSSTSDTFELILFDIFGRIIVTETSNNGIAIVKRDKLPAGVFSFSILNDGSVISRGKIVAE